VLLIPADLGLPTPRVGDTVTMTDQDGASSVDVTVDSFTDPYRKFAKKRPPAKGARYVLASVTLESTGDAPFAVERSGFLLRDANGYLWGATEIEYAKKPKVKDFRSVSLANGNRVKGLLGYQVPRDVALDGIYYQGRSGLFRLLDLSAGTPTTGTSSAPTCGEMNTWWTAVNPLLGRLVALPPFQEDAAPMDEAASEEMLADLQAIRSDLLEVPTPDSLVAIQRRTLGGLLLYERSAEDQVTAARGDADSLALSGQAFDAAQLVINDALDALKAAGLDDC
jgi:hypothetical protein